MNLDVVLNTQGKNKYNTDSWSEYQIHFNMDSFLPYNCELWFDGCNSCLVTNNEINTCTEMKCDTLNRPHCLRYINGH